MRYQKLPESTMPTWTDLPIAHVSPRRCHGLPAARLLESKTLRAAFWGSLISIWLCSMVKSQGISPASRGNCADYLRAHTVLLDMEFRGAVELAQHSYSSLPPPPDCRVFGGFGTMLFLRPGGPLFIANDYLARPTLPGEPVMAQGVPREGYHTGDSLDILSRLAKANGGLAFFAGLLNCQRSTSSTHYFPTHYLFLVAEIHSDDVKWHCTYMKHADVLAISVRAL